MMTESHEIYNTKKNSGDDVVVDERKRKSYAKISNNTAKMQ